MKPLFKNFLVIIPGAVGFSKTNVARAGYRKNRAGNGEPAWLAKPHAADELGQ